MEHINDFRKRKRKIKEIRLENLNFNWKIKERPEDFIVKEISQFEFQKNSQHHLYLLIKRKYNTKELAEKFGFSYAGLKDKNALTFQYVSFEEYIGDLLKEKQKDKFYIFQYLGTIKRKIKIGNLKGNKFAVKLKSQNFELKDWMINYYDLQRIKNNWEKGKELLKKLKIKNNTRKRLSWLENFYIDSYLSYIWNKSFENYLKENFKGYFINENGYSFFIPETDYQYMMENIPKFWTILGYKADSKDNKNYYTQILKNDFELDEFIEILRNLKIKGDYRKTFVRVGDINFDGNYLSFFLPKGSYGTMYLKHIFQK